MRFRWKLLCFLLLHLLLLTSCIELVPPEAETESTSANTTESTGVTTSDQIPQKDLFLSDEEYEAFFHLQPTAKKTYDEVEVYRHVFENHSRKLTPEELETVEVDCQNGQALISVRLDINKDGSNELYDVYLVEGFTSKGYNQNCSKYSAQLPWQRYDQTSTYAFVKHDYHEAYLDVLFKNVTFSACDGKPDYGDLVYQMGSFFLKSQNRSYSVCSDGYLYYAENPLKENEQYYRSDQKMDVAYLASILWMSNFFEFGAHKDHTYLNEIFALDEPCTVKYVERFDKTYHIDQDGTYHLIYEPSWVYWESGGGFEMGEMALYCQKTTAFWNFESRYGLTE